MMSVKGLIMRHGVIFYFFVLVFLVSFIGGSVFSTYEFFVADGPLQQRKEVLIEKGMSLRSIAGQLKEENIIESASIFTLGVRAHNKSGMMKAGEYSIPARASAKMVMDILTGGQTFIRRVTVPEGLTSMQIVDIINQGDGLVGDITETPRNGTLMPETYYYSYGDTKASIIGRMQNAMKRTIDDLWPDRADGLPFKSPEQVIILASIVEKETSIKAERPHVASVFLNRLNQNMRLQSDPTVLYAITDGDLSKRRKLYTNDLHLQHPYNTYVIYGLPPTPISNPGRDSIAAVLNPFESEDIYFVADGSGGHIFSKTYDEHNKNVQQWRALRGDKAAQAAKRSEKKIQNVPMPPSVLPTYEYDLDNTIDLKSGL